MTDPALNLRQERVLGGAILAGLAGLVWLLMVWIGPDVSGPVESTPVELARTRPDPAPAAAPAVPRATTPATPETAQFVARDERKIALLPEAAELAGQLHRVGGSGEEDLDILQTLIGLYRRANAGANPAGGLNEEIAGALRGRNPQRFAVLPEGLPAFDPEGQLRDRWGTPYFFHPVSRDVLEIRSAGPDRRLWTDDDVQSSETSSEPPDRLSRKTGE